MPCHCLQRCNAGEFTNFAIVKVVGFIAQQVQGRTSVLATCKLGCGSRQRRYLGYLRRLVILTDMQPESNPGSMIGNPQPHDVRFIVLRAFCDSLIEF